MWGHHGGSLLRLGRRGSTRPSGGESYRCLPALPCVRSFSLGEGPTPATVALRLSSNGRVIQRISIPQPTTLPGDVTFSRGSTTAVVRFHMESHLARTAQVVGRGIRVWTMPELPCAADQTCTGEACFDERDTASAWRQRAALAGCDQRASALGRNPRIWAVPTTATPLITSASHA